MRVAFVGVKRKYQELAPEYRDFFTKYHLELPHYYAIHGTNQVTLTTVDHTDMSDIFPYLEYQHEDEFRCDGETKYDVVVHWRKWFPEFYRPEAINVINCQDHTFGRDWEMVTWRAFDEGKLYGFTCFPGWHRRNLLTECDWLPDERAIAGVTLGVDTDIYTPSAEKNPFEMLWSSDPGRGLDQAVLLVLRLHQRDQRFKLHICWPDYCRPPQRIAHPALVWHGNVPNGPKLWDLFNRTGILPYTSTFKEPSSRAHRQAMAAGSMVLYPPDMGTPSELIVHGETGIVAPTSEWAQIIIDRANSGRWKELGDRARQYAVAENWAVQAKRFNAVFEELLRSRE